MPGLMSVYRIGMTDRETYVTELVTSWLLSDLPRLNVARDYAAKAERHFLVAFAMETLQRAEPGTPAWEVDQELAPLDYPRIDWAAVMERLARA